MLTSFGRAVCLFNQESSLRVPYTPSLLAPDSKTWSPRPLLLLQSEAWKPLVTTALPILTAPSQPSLASGAGWLLSAVIPDLGREVAPLSFSCTVAAWHSRLLPLTSDVG